MQLFIGQTALFCNNLNVSVLVAHALSHAFSVASVYWENAGYCMQAVLGQHEPLA